MLEPCELCGSAVIPVETCKRIEVDFQCERYPVCCNRRTTPEATEFLLSLEVISVTRVSLRVVKSNGRRTSVDILSDVLNR